MPATYHNKKLWIWSSAVTEKAHNSNWRSNIMWIHTVHKKIDTLAYRTSSFLQSVKNEEHNSFYVF